MKNIFRKIEVRVLYATWALKIINRPKLGDSVEYQNKKYILIQGVANPIWELMDVDRNVVKVHVANFKLQPLLKRFIFSFMSSYKFQMSYWYDIDVRQKSGMAFL